MDSETPIRFQVSQRTAGDGRAYYNVGPVGGGILLGALDQMSAERLVAILNDAVVAWQREMKVTGTADTKALARDRFLEAWNVRVGSHGYDKGTWNWVRGVLEASGQIG